MGFAQSLARPGGNMTGMASQYDELITKQLQLLKETLPALTRIAILRHSQASAVDPDEGRVLGEKPGTRGADPHGRRTWPISRERSRKARNERVGAVHVLPSPYLGANRAPLIALASRFRLPAFYELRLYVEDGGLMSYGPNLDDLYGRSATYVDRILKGADPATMAIEQPGAVRARDQSQDCRRR
jgi:putative ABC transport system substrate-binding protein